MMKTLNLMCVCYMLKICKIIDIIDSDSLNDNINDLVDLMIKNYPNDYNFIESMKMNAD
jgi:endoglucanase Acf2